MFESITAFLISMGINPSHVFAGLSGALVRTFIMGKRWTWETLMGSLVGALCAIYLTPLIGTWLGLNLLDLSVNNALAFALGMLGLSLAEGLVRLAQRWANNPKLPVRLSMRGFAEAVNEADEKPKSKAE
ncbi:hypothetical protein [Brucella anthropi]|uniref:hypothetical protein n=1 Tax=Brucella anthropi TaxID=529 RepID=UPI0021655C15|nr:hypothetical protein [Brucella anthropi]MBM7323870.1 hypothetical protein [Agrobacterium sp. S2]UVV67093.1 hypothetical protein NW321_11540 [Brucella anthropi]